MAAFCHCVIQIVYRNEFLDGPLVCLVFMLLAVVDGSMNVVKTPRGTVSQFMSEMYTLQYMAVPYGIIHTNNTGAIRHHYGHGAILFHGKGDDLYILLFHKIIEGGNFHCYSFFPASLDFRKAANRFTSSYMASVISPSPPKRANLISSSLTVCLEPAPGVFSVP